MKSKKLKLRALTKTDLDKTLKWHNQEDIQELYSGHPFPINREMEELWYNKILTSNYPTTIFGIELLENSELIGITLIKNINNINRNAEFAIYIGENQHKGKGYSKESTIETLKFAFLKLGLNRIYLKVLEKNNVAYNLYKKVGFKKEGIIRQSVFKNGGFHDEIMMSILNKEFDV